MRTPAGSSSTVSSPASRRDPERFFRTDHLLADLRGRTVRGGAVSVAASFGTQVLRMAAVIVMARLLSPSDNGLFAMVSVITGFVLLFSDFGLSSVTIQQPVITQPQVSALFWINMLVSVALTLIVALTAPLVAWFYGEPRLLWMQVVLSTSFLVSGLIIQHQALMKRQMRFTSLSVIEVASRAIDIAAGIAAALAGMGYWSLVVMALASLPFRTVATWWVCPWWPNRPAIAQGLRPMLAFGGNLTGFRMLQFAVRNLDNVLIGRVHGPVALGLYSKAYNLLVLPLQLFDRPMANVALPVLSRLTDQPRRYREAYAGIVAGVCILTMPLVAFFVGTSDWLIVTLLGEQWRESAAIFAWLGISGLVEPFSFTIGWLFTSQDRTRQQFRWGIVNAALMISGMVAGLPWGAEGVAGGYALTGVCIRTPLLFWYAGRQGPVTMRDMYVILAPFAATVAMTLAALVAFRELVEVERPVVGLLAAAAITGVTTLGTLAILPSGRPALHELRRMPDMLLSRKASGWTP